MNPYQPSYGYPPQQASGPPQPPWQAPPRRQGWADPRLQAQQSAPSQPQSHPSSYHTASASFGPPLAAPPPPAQYPPGQFDASGWGVRYNQGLAAPIQEPKPPLPPRPSSATGRISPLGDAQNSGPPPAGVGSHYTTSWNDPYHASPSGQAPTFEVPPPPPPRPAEYQAQIQAHHNRTNTPMGVPHQEYSHQPPSHHYDPQPQGLWNAQSGSSSGPQYHPTAPPPPQVSGTIDGPLVSPIDSTNTYWSRPGQSNATQAPSNYNASSQPVEDRRHSQALGFGGPSDWEHYDPNLPPEDTPTSPAPDRPYHSQGPISPPQVHATLPNSHTPSIDPPRPSHPIEMGAASPVAPRTDWQFPPPSGHYASAPTAMVSATPPPQPADIRPSSAGQYGSSISVRSDSLNGAGNIDSVIQAWNAPVKAQAAQSAHVRSESRASVRVASPDLSPTVKLVDPYADLEPEFKASLKRYAAMLRKEAAAETDDEKFDIFHSFVTKELRLRSLLYGVELKKEVSEVRKAANVADIEAALPKSAVSAGPGVFVDQAILEKKLGEHTASSAPQGPPPDRIEDPQPPVTQAIAPKEPPQAEEPKIVQTMPSVPPAPLKPVAEERPKSRDDSFVIIPAPGRGEGEEEAYSPGGRPMMSRVPKAPETKPLLSTAIHDQLRSTSPALSPSNDAPMVIEDYAMPDPTSPGSNAPILVMPAAIDVQQPGLAKQSDKPVTPIKFEPPRPIYTPFRYSTAVQEEKAKTLQPADQAYSSLRHSVADSGRLMAQESLLPPVRPTSSSGRREHEEAFIGLIRKQSMAVRQKTPGPPATMRAGANTPRPEPPMIMRVGTPAVQKPPVEPLKDAVLALRALLPKGAMDDEPLHPKLQTVKGMIDSVPDEFGFIHESVVEWDSTNRMVKKEQDAERHARQQESEARIDALFNDNEIGYADIGELEADFKLAEAERKYQEDQEELESFTKQVFTPVTERLQKETAELTTAYTMSIDVLDLESEPVSRCFKPKDKGGIERAARMSEAMSHVLALFNKIEIRHRKVAEAHMERERRRKHLELTVLYTNGDTTGVKNLEKEFAVAEKMQVLHEARGKDTRANKLMDTFDRATVRGLGDNQMFIDDVLVKLQALKKAIADGGDKEKLFEPEGPRETLSLAQDVMDTVTTDSRRLLGLSNEADILLNDADYGVSVAEARAANADAATYGNLQNEKTKEDAKLIEETNARISSVTKGPQDAIALIREVIQSIGDDPEHEERMKKALEAAKQRNASLG